MTTDPCNGQVLVDCLAVLPRLEVPALPAFGMVRDFVLSIEGGPLVSLAFAVNVLAALTGSASAVSPSRLCCRRNLSTAHRGTRHGLGPLHRVAVLSAGTLDSL
jgi:hypothetical protein